MKATFHQAGSGTRMRTQKVRWRPSGPTGPEVDRVSTRHSAQCGGNDPGRPVFAAALSTLGQPDAEVLFTVGPMDPKSLGEVPANITVAGYVPQAEAMLCYVIVRHAGSGTTVASPARGLPMVAIPMFDDQMHNAERLVAAGIGLRVDPDGSRTIGHPPSSGYWTTRNTEPMPCVSPTKSQPARHRAKLSKRIRTMVAG